MNYGYARVSTIAQNLDRQLDELSKLGIDENKNKEKLDLIKTVFALIGLVYILKYFIK